MVLGAALGTMAVTLGGPGCAALALLSVNPSDLESSLAGAAGDRLLVAGRMVDMRRCLLRRTGCSARVLLREPGRATRYVKYSMQLFLGLAGTLRDRGLCCLSSGAAPWFPPARALHGHSLMPLAQAIYRPSLVVSGGKCFSTMQ